MGEGKMGLKLFAIFLLYLISFGVAYGGPNWVKRGLVAVYSAQLLSGYQGRTGPSGTAGFGNAIFLVEGFIGETPYGHFFLAAASSGGVFYQERGALFKLPELSFYLDPKEADRWLKEKPPKNCKVFGRPGDITVECQSKGEKSLLKLKFDRKGLITYALTGAWQRGANWQSLQTEFSLKTVKAISLPKSPTPPEALKPHAYSLHLFTPIGSSPLGTLEVAPEGKGKGPIRFKITGPQGTRFELGTALMGPHYINPKLLGKEHIISIPEGEFEIKKLREDKLGTLVGVFYQGQLVEERVYDKRTGLLLRAKVPSVGGYTVITLMR